MWPLPDCGLHKMVRRSPRSKLILRAVARTSGTSVRRILSSPHRGDGTGTLTAPQGMQTGQRGDGMLGHGGSSGSRQMFECHRWAEPR